MSQPLFPPPPEDDPSQGPPRDGPEPYPTVADRGNHLGSRRGVGIAAGVLAPFLLPGLAGLVMSLVGLMLGGGDRSPVGLFLAAQWLPVVVGVVLLFLPRWRRFAAGYWIGLGIVLIVAAGACVALIVAFVQSYQ